MVELKMVNILDLTVGNVVHCYGARFEITETRLVESFNQVLMVAVGRWLDGETFDNYFGPDRDWIFQGNNYVTLKI